MAVAAGHVPAIEVSIPSTPSDEMSTDNNQQDLTISTGNHRVSHNPFNIMSMNTTIMPPPQPNLEPNNFFERMLESFSTTIQKQAQEALRHKWYALHP